MRAVVVGAGAVGARAARQLREGGVDALVVVDTHGERAERVAASLGGSSVSSTDDFASALDRAVAAGGVDVVVLCAPVDQRGFAQRALDSGASVVSVADDDASARGLLALDAEAFERGRTVVVGAGMAPGLSCLLARHAAADLTAVDEIHVAKAGTGGPACARSHHRSLRLPMREWRDGAFAQRRSGSGRELCWFPEPIGGLDCYRAAVGDATLLHAAFPSAARVTARVAATRRDRVTSRLPMLRPPHAEGELGAVRVEVRGWRGAVTDTRVLGAIDRPAFAAGTVAAVAARWTAAGRFRRAGAGGLADLVAEPVQFLTELSDLGVRAAVFEGSLA